MSKCIDPETGNIIIGLQVKHSEQKYVGKIKTDLGRGYCLVDLDNADLKLLYPFGIKASIDKLDNYVQP